MTDYPYRILINWRDAVPQIGGYQTMEEAKAAAQRILDTDDRAWCAWITVAGSDRLHPVHD